MPDIADGESVEVQGSGSKPYVLRNVGGVYSCTCPAWRNQSLAIEQRTCKHLRGYRGAEAEAARVGDPATPARTAVKKEDSDAPPLLLAETWQTDADLTGWWMSEKLDGVRAFWDGETFRSRLGNVFRAPDWFAAGLGDVALDGELWIGRKAFQRTVSIARRQDKSDLWKELVYVVFDAPQVAEPFEERMAFLTDHLGKRGLAYARAHEHVVCKSLEHLKAELDRIASAGGEGLMLRKPGSRYEAGRSSTLLKVKRFLDAEARVIGHLEGGGRHKGRLGALRSSWTTAPDSPWGQGFPTRSAVRPAVGSTITFRYQELSDRGVPRFPSFVGLRAENPIAPAASAVAKASIKTTSASSAVAKASIKTTSASKKQTIKPSVAAAPAGKSPAPTAVPISGGTTMSARHFEFVEGKSAKFWEISVLDSDVTVRFGRIGTNGQTQTKSFPNPAAALAHAEKLIAEKTDKGYVETPHGT